MEILGYKANMTNIDASLLIHQLERIEKLHKKREQIAQSYDKGFSKNTFIKTLPLLSNSKHGRFLYTILVNPKMRDKFISLLEQKGISVAVHFKPVHFMSYYKHKFKYKAGAFPIAELIGNSTISLPFYPKLKSEEVKYIIRTVNEIITK